MFVGLRFRFYSLHPIPYDFLHWEKHFWKTKYTVPASGGSGRIPPNAPVTIILVYSLPRPSGYVIVIVSTTTQKAMLIACISGKAKI